MTLQTTDALPGLTDAATFYAQEAKKAGVKVNVKTVPGSSYFNPSLLFMKMPFAQDSLADRLALHAYHLLGTSTAPVNEGHWHEPDVRRAGAGGRVDALADEGEGSLWTQAQRTFWTGLELHRLGPPPLDERHHSEPERRRAGLALPARRHEDLELVVLVAPLRGRAGLRHGPAASIHGMSFAGEAATGPEEIELTTAHRKRLPCCGSSSAGC